MNATASLATRIQPRLTASAFEVLGARYLKKDDRDLIVDTPADLCTTASPFAKIGFETAAVRHARRGSVASKWTA